MRDLTYLKQAMEIEEKAINSAKACYDYYQKAGDSERAGIMKLIIDDDTRHTTAIQELINKLEK